MAFPTLIVEAGFTIGASTSTYIHLNDATRGKLDTGTLAPDVTWEDITAYVHSGSIRRGASRADGPILRYEAGTCTIELNNSDRRFDPTNLSGPYTSGGATLVTPMRAIRIRATYGATTYDLFRGYADAWDIDYDGPNYSMCTLTATDAVKVLSSYDRVAVSAVGAGENAGARVTRILNSAAWSATDRVIATGDSTLLGTTLDGDAWPELLLVADSEIGEIYVDAAGRVVFRNRQAVLEDTRSNIAQAAFGDDGVELRYADVDVVYDDTALLNLVRSARVGGTQQTAQDATSQTAYLIHTHERNDLLLQTDAAANDWGDFVLYQSKDPELRFAALTVNPLADDANLFPQVLGREFGDRITINRRPPGGGTITRDVFIRGVQHDFSPMQWRTTWTLQSATKYQFLILDHATLGKLNSNALAF